MKACIVAKQKPADNDPLECTEKPLPEPSLGEVRLKVHVCGVCHTDLHIAEGDLDLHQSPITPGHQVVGTVDALGEGVNTLKTGDRVGVTWLFSACGECHYCLTGQENLCENALFSGYDHDGGFAEYMTLPASFAHPLPESLDDVEAAPLLCAGVIGYRSLRLCEIQHGGRLGLYGFGASAHIAIQIARHWDCEVHVFTRSEEHREHARQLGAVWTGDARDTVPNPLDASITFAPVGWIIPEALRNLRRGGTLAINAVHLSPIPELKYELLYHERTVRSVANLTRQDARELLELAASIPIRTDAKAYPIDKANEALKDVKHSRISGAAVLIIH